MSVTLTCVECGSKFKVEPYRAEKAKYCSRACFIKRQFPIFAEKGHAALRGQKPWNYEERTNSERKSIRRANAKKSYQANRERIIVQTIQWTKDNPEKVAEIQKRYRKRHPKRASARTAISNAVAQNQLPRASELLCSICGSKADHYHHHFGYEQAHWYDVIPVCVACHNWLHHW